MLGSNAFLPGWVFPLSMGDCGLCGDALPPPHLRPSAVIFWLPGGLTLRCVWWIWPSPFLSFYPVVATRGLSALLCQTTPNFSFCLVHSCYVNCYLHNNSCYDCWFFLHAWRFWVLWSLYCHQVDLCIANWWVINSQSYSNVSSDPYHLCRPFHIYTHSQIIQRFRCSGPLSFHHHLQSQSTVVL